MAGTAQAAEFQFSGFGSFIAGAKDHNVQKDITPPIVDNDRDLRSYAGYTTSDLTFDPDSLVGVQASVQANDKASVTVQLVSRGAEEWNTEVDWAYVRYQFTDELAGRVGRIRVPFYLYSDFITVGYAYPWITPPSEVYSIPFSNVNGADVVFQHALGSVDMLLQGYVGSEKFTFRQPSPLAGNEGETRNQFGLISEFSWRAFKFRYAYHAADVYGDTTGTPLATLVTGLNAFGQTETADNFSYDRKNVDFHDMAVQYDNGSLVLIAENIILSGHDEAPTPVNKGYFAMAGYRFGTVMPMVTWSSRNDEESDLTSDLDPVSSIPAPQYAAVYAAAIGAQKSLVVDTEQVTVGVRWDFTDGMAFKAEVIDLEDKNYEEYNTVLTRAGIQVVF